MGARFSRAHWTKNDQMDIFSELHALSLTFSKTWDPMHLRYGFFSNLARSAHCDGKFIEYSLNSRFKADYLSTCGTGCKELSQQFAGPVHTAYAVNKMDHTQFVVFGTNATGGTRATGPL